jgi:hypothetical protein
MEVQSMRLKFTLPALGAMMALVAAPAQAQSCSIDNATGGSCPIPHDLRANVNTVASLSSVTPSTTLLVTAADFLLGTKTAPGPVLTVGANTPWTLSVHGPANWTGPTGTSKPVGDIAFGTPVGDVPVGVTASSFDSGIAGPALPRPTMLKTKWSYATDRPGTYDITLTFTLTAP